MEKSVQRKSTGMLRLLPNKDTNANKSAALRRHAERTNALAAVSRLPVEVLILALEFYVLSSYDKPECVILPITQVCRRWREIVLHTPSLWTRIELPADTEYLSAALQYSKAQTLDVKIGDATAGALDLVVAELPRTRYLSIESNLNYLNFKEVDVPNLKTLYTLYGDPETCADFMRALRSTHSLHEVTFVYFYGCWQTLRRFTNLRFLSVYPSYGTLSHGEPTALEDVFDCLRLLPSLETLWIDCNILRSGTITPSRTRLPSVSHIRLTGSDLSCAEVLKHLELPSLVCAVIVGVDVEYPEYEDLAVAATPVMLQLANSIKTLGLPLSLCLLDVEANQDVILSLDYPLPPGDALTHTQGCHPPFSFQCLFPDVDTTRDHLLGYLPLEPVRRIHLKLNHDSRPATTESLSTALVRATPSVEELVVEYLDCNLRELSQVFGTIAAESCPYPRLRSLTVDGRRCKCRQVYLEHRCPTFLEQTLQLWTYPGKTLGRLTLCYSVPPSTEQLARLRMFADEVEVTVSEYYW